ncbi:MAG TPA: hypothetical protein VFU21_29760, partial [Kofleriaceae bacterium]|nr:hypothetical protein [Kofleriaceae bacterium]
MTMSARAVLLLLVGAAACATADRGADGGPERSDGALLPDASRAPADAAATDAEPHGDGSPVINEFVSDHGGADDCEYVEITGAPGTDYSRY